MDALHDGRRLPMDDVQDNHPPTYDELWKACIEYENRIAKLEAELEEAKEEIISETKWADEYHEKWLAVKTDRDALVRLFTAAERWLWHQGKHGGKWYTSAPSEQKAKQRAYTNLVDAIEATRKEIEDDGD